MKFGKARVEDIRRFFAEVPDGEEIDCGTDVENNKFSVYFDARKLSRHVMMGDASDMAEVTSGDLEFLKKCRISL